MDPVANFQEQLEVAREMMVVWDRCPESGEPTELHLDLMYQHGIRLAELVLALDEWRRKGGFDPYTAKEDV